MAKVGLSTGSVIDFMEDKSCDLPADDIVRWSFPGGRYIEARWTEAGLEIRGINGLRIDMDSNNRFYVTEAKR